MAFKVIKGEGVPENFRPFSPATQAGGFVFVSGQASVDDKGNIIPDTFENEFRRTMENIRKVLAGAKLDLSHVVRVTSYVAEPSDVAEYNKLYREYFKEPFPARTTLTNCLPKGLIKFEMDVIAYAGE